MSIYHDKQRALQDAFDTRRLADVIESNNLHVTFNPLDEAFIAGKDFFFLATADASGKPSCSFKAGPAGFVRIVDERTLVDLRCAAFRAAEERGAALRGDRTRV